MPILRHIYDSATGAYHDVEVSQEVYDFYRRDAWAMQRQDTRFYAHEIQFSSLVGGKDGAFENFSEFISREADPQGILCRRVDIKIIVEAFQSLSLPNQHLLYFLVVEGHTERWYGQKMGMHHMTVHNKKERALLQLYRFFVAKKTSALRN